MADSAPEKTGFFYFSDRTRRGYDPRPAGWGLAGITIDLFDDGSEQTRYGFSEHRNRTTSPYPLRVEVTATTRPDGEKHFLAEGPFVDINGDRVTLPEAPEHAPVRRTMDHTDDQHFAHRVMTVAVTYTQQQQRH